MNKKEYLKQYHEEWKTNDPEGYREYWRDVRVRYMDKTGREKRRKYQREYYARNRERILEYSRNYRALHHDEIYEYQKEWRRKRDERIAVA